MSELKREKLRRKADACHQRCVDLVDQLSAETITPDEFVDLYGAADDKYCKAFNEYLVYPRVIDWGADPNGSVFRP